MSVKSGRFLSLRNNVYLDYMKLYLSSEDFGNHLEKLQQMVGEDKRVLFIDNAKDYLPEDERAQHVAEKSSNLSKLVLSFLN